MVNSNKGDKGKSVSKNTGMHVIKFYFLFPLVVGSFASRKKKLEVSKIMRANSQASLLRLRVAFEMPCPYHVDPHGRVVAPTQSITGLDYHASVSEQIVDGDKSE